MKKILMLCGSTKSSSTNSQILKMIRDQHQNTYVFFQYDISKLPFFNPDLNNENVPTEVIDFQNQLKQACAVVICTPEFVFSLPGVLKNALEWTVSSSGFSGKQVALIVAASQGEKAFESLQLIMRTIEAKFDDGTTLLIQGAKAKADTIDTLEKLNKLMSELSKRIS